MSQTLDDRVAHFEVAHLEAYTQSETRKLHMRLHTFGRQKKEEAELLLLPLEKTLFYKAFPLT